MGAADFGELGKFLVLDRYARPRVHAADEALGFSLLQRFRAADTDYSEYSQVAFLVGSLALADRAEHQLGMRPRYCAGPSFGQKAAAVYAGAMDFADAVRMTFAVARHEHEYFRSHHTDVVSHTVVRVPEESLARLLADLTGQGHWLEVSGDLDKGFAMVSMREGILDEFKRAITAMGGYSMYTMRPPAHCGIFGELRRQVEREIFDDYKIRAPQLPVISDQDGSLITTAEDMRAMMLDTFDRPFSWPAMVGSLRAAGVRTVYVTGPDAMFFRLDSTVRHFEVTKVDPKAAFRPAPVGGGT
jgi:[acyl-carrier-protein] S-malonyltransferase